SDPSPLVTGEVINVRLIRETTVLENGQTKKTETDYETSTASCSTDACTLVSPYTTTWLNPTEVREYDWGAGTPGPLLRRADTAYLHRSNSTYLNLNIADRPTSVIVYDGASNIASQTVISYDQGTLTATSGATGHDYASFGAGFTTRG